MFIVALVILSKIYNVGKNKLNNLKNKNKN